MATTAEHFVKSQTNISRTSNCNKLLSTYLFSICGPLLFHLRLLINNNKLKYRRRTTKLMSTTEQHVQTGNSKIDACAYVLLQCYFYLEVGYIINEGNTFEPRQNSRNQQICQDYFSKVYNHAQSFFHYTLITGM